MKNQSTNMGVGCLRGAVFAIPLLIILPIAVWVEYKFLYGFLAFLGGLITLIIVVNSAKNLTAIDIVLPFVISLISCVIFFPVGLFAGNFFSFVTCPAAGLMLSVGLALYKAGRLPSFFLIVPTLAFIYEILPIDLPTDIDNIIGLGANGVNIFVKSIFFPATNNKKIEKY